MAAWAGLKRLLCRAAGLAAPCRRLVTSPSSSLLVKQGTRHRRDQPLHRPLPLSKAQHQQEITKTKPRGLEGVFLSFLQQSGPFCLLPCLSLAMPDSFQRSPEFPQVPPSQPQFISAFGIHTLTSRAEPSPTIASYTQSQEPLEKRKKRTPEEVKGVVHGISKENASSQRLYCCALKSETKREKEQ